jgi:hypothetical protein
LNNILLLLSLTINIIPLSLLLTSHTAPTPAAKTYYDAEYFPHPPPQHNSHFLFCFEILVLPRGLSYIHEEKEIKTNGLVIHATPPFSRAKSREFSPLPTWECTFCAVEQRQQLVFFNEFLAGAIHFRSRAKNVLFIFK